MAGMCGWSRSVVTNVFLGVFSVIMFSISGAMLFSLIRFKKERSHRNYLVTLSETNSACATMNASARNWKNAWRRCRWPTKSAKKCIARWQTSWNMAAVWIKENESLCARLKGMKTTLCPANWNCWGRGRACPDARRAGAGACFRHDRRRRSGEAVAHPAQIPCGQPVGLLCRSLLTEYIRALPNALSCAFPSLRLPTASSACLSACTSAMHRLPRSLPCLPLPCPSRSSAWRSGWCRRMGGCLPTERRWRGDWKLLRMIEFFLILQESRSFKDLDCTFIAESGIISLVFPISINCFLPTLVPDVVLWVEIYTEPYSVVL